VAGLVLREDRDGVAVLVLNRPYKRNALSIDMRFELADALATAADDAVACAILTGAGTAFCAGMDVTQFGGDRAHKEQLVESSERCFEAVATFPKPLIADVNGPAIAGGFALALLCDVRVARPGASFGFVSEAGQRYVPPSYAAARAALGPALARELCLTGRMLDAREAVRLGVALEGPASELAERIAAAPAALTREVKRRILDDARRTWMPLLDDERRALREALTPKA
jgi:enoyl-CoA hydratase/carnithine racemase